MRNLLVYAISYFLFAVVRRHTTWFIDGYNLMGHRGVTKGKTLLIDRLKDIKARDADVVVVFDGKFGDGAFTSKKMLRDDFAVVTTAEGLTADDYILQEMQAIRDTGLAHNCRVVTGDRKLRKQSLLTRPVCKGVVNPRVFWRRYRARMSGYKNKGRQHPRTEPAKKPDSYYQLPTDQHWGE
mmetsp:Transcript_21109/g.48730  ORF Transcript_21109/g.48730 Transcript_21109/m.48730 type:complete len:182 (+) Transcript_21109:268-813(+)|eukprot:CAMPEP_0116842636 /NCGR_PEP_ID=MMETSP0418-20121206/11630_1 /TAXON_ID=1158023 /ORGANISM="Astrosyne radiata, Strain 13vi08-1A" /LENGTH=181 /DNA_ID=CAMNT_0004473275 /DNA_START=274 /DNA_END=819 /DNA_ORIENTATION=+